MEWTLSGKILLFRRSGELPLVLSEEALVAAYATGSPAALASLFERFCDPVYRFLGSYVGKQSPDLDDLVQATFLEVMRAASKFRGGASVQTWIFGIAINVARHHRRSEWRRLRLLGSVFADRPSPTAEVEDSACKREKVSQLALAITALPEHLRAPIVLCDVEGTSGQEAARVLNIPEGTLWRRLHEARKQLRSALGEVQK